MCNRCAKLNKIAENGGLTKDEATEFMEKPVMHRREQLQFDLEYDTLQIQLNEDQ
jgi:hypothetical protein